MAGGNGFDGEVSRTGGRLAGDPDAAPAHGAWSDPALTEAFRESFDDRALAELYERHGPAVRAYARMCCRDTHTAEDLASEAFARTIQAVRSGAGPEASWRPYLLTVVRRTATDWAGTARRTELSADFGQWLEAQPGADADAPGGEERVLRQEDHGMVLRGFRSLPERWQAALWYSVVEGESTERIGTLLGISASGVASLTSRAREGLRDAYLSAHAASGSRSDECRHYSAMLGAAVRRPGRGNRPLQHHLDHCARCRRALTELAELNERLSAVLPAAVLLWAGPAYLTARVTAAATGATATASGTVTGHAATGHAATGHATTGPGAGARLVARAKASPVGTSVAALAVTALVLGGLTLLPDGGQPSTRSAGADPRNVVALPSSGGSPTPRSSPSPTAGSARPSPSHSSASPSPTGPSASASPSPSASASATATPGAGAPDVSRAPADDVTRLRLASTGRCMEIPGGSPAEGVRVQEAACDGGAHQQWDLLRAQDGSRLQLRNTGTGMCLSNTGTDQDGAPVTQTACDASRPTQLWTLYAPPGEGEARFIQEGGTMYLGLDEWNLAADGKPHSALIGTTHHYYASPSFGFLYDGALFDGH